MKTILEINKMLGRNTIPQLPVYDKLLKEFPNADEINISKTMRFLESMGKIEIDKDTLMIKILDNDMNPENYGMLDDLEDHLKGHWEPKKRRRKKHYEDYSKPLKKFMGGNS